MILDFLEFSLKKTKRIMLHLAFMNSFNTLTTAFTLAYGIGSAGRYVLRPLQIFLFS